MKKVKFLGFILLTSLTLSCSKKNIGEDVSLASPKSRSNNVISFANDPFAAYLNSVPTILSTISTVNSGAGSAAITTKKLTFSSRGGVNVVYGVMAYPQAPGTYPGIIVLHGGGSNAEGVLGTVQSLAARGYVTFSIDQPGICGTGNTPNSSGPWKSKPAGEGPRFVVTPTAGESTLADAGIANLQAFNLLASQANVIPTKMGITGTSWGGYSTTLLSGLLGTRVLAAYSNFGCGYYDSGSFWTNIINGLSPSDKSEWLLNFDAGRRAANLSAAYFIESPSNDTYFWPEAVRGTLDAISATNKNLVITPNLNHVTSASHGTMKNLFFDYYLKNTGSPFGKITITGAVTQGNGTQVVTMAANLPAGVSVSSVKLYYSDPSVNWQNRNWIGINATLVSGSTYTATIPATVVANNSDFYAHMEDSRTVLVSSYMQKTVAGPQAYLDKCDAASGWAGGNPLTINTTDKKEGSGSLQSVGAGTDEFKKVFASAYNSGVPAATGKLQFWYYVSDVTKFNASNQIELGSGGAADVSEYNWNIGTLVNGWNLITKTFASATTTGGTPNLNAINWIRIYHSKNASLTTRVDAVQILP